jgi:hypothetical protein
LSYVYSNRTKKFWLHVLLFLKKGLSMLKSPLLTLKSLRPLRDKEMGKCKVLLRKMAPHNLLCLLLQLTRTEEKRENAKRS